MQDSSPGSAQVGDISVTGTLLAGALSGDGSGLTGLDAGNLASGTVPSSVVSGTYSGITGVGTLGSLSVSGAGTLGSSVTSGTALMVNAANTFSGNLADLQVNGASQLSVDQSGSVVAAGNLAINGGSLTTSSGSADVFNSNATTLNIGGAASTLSLGIVGATPTVGTLHIADSSGAAQSLTIGSLAGAGSTTIQAGTGNINLSTNQSGAGVVIKTLSNNSSSAFAVQDSTGATLLGADTANTRVTLNAESSVGTLYGSTLFSDNFESGNLQMWQGNSNMPGISTTIVHSGKYSMSFDASGGSRYVAARISSDAAFARAWIYVQSQSSSDLRVMGLDNGAGNGYTWNVLRNNLGQICINNSAVSTTNCGGNFTMGVWHLVELQIAVDTPTTGTTNLWLDGSNIYSSTTDNDGVAGGPALQDVYVGDDRSGACCGSGFIDDVAVATSRNSVTASLNVQDTLNVDGNTALNGGLFVKSGTQPLQFTNAYGTNILHVSPGSGNGQFPGGTTTINTSGTLIQPTYSDNTQAFEVQNNAGLSLFQIDTANNNIIIGGNNSGALQPWTTNANPLPAVRYFHGSVVANGYIYVLGGRDCCGRNATVYYAKINSDGSAGTWSTSPNALPQVLSGLTTVVANGYVYAIGGDNSGGVPQSTVYYAKLNSDGSTGAWITSSNALPQALVYHTSVVANGYAYVMGGTNSSGINQSTVYYAKLNSDGSTGSWSTDVNALPQARTIHSSVAANGYVYVIAGYDAGNNVRSTVYYAKLNSDGSTGSWSTNAAALPQPLYEASSVVANGYVYVIGGGQPPGWLSTIYYAKLNSDGSTGSWSTNANVLPQAICCGSSVVANGYVYYIGGVASGWNDQATVYYASTQRIQLGGSLDLVGLAGQDLADPGSTGGAGATGGELTAGNTNVIGSLQVQGASQFAQGLGINGPLTVGSGEIGTSAATANLFNLGPTTLNIGGNATTLNLSNTTTSATTVNIGTEVTGAGTNGALNLFTGLNGGTSTLTIGAGSGVVTIGTNASGAANLFNTNATALNIGGSATTLSLGIVGSTNVAGTIHIADSAGASASQTVTLGSLVGAGTTTIQAGTGNINLDTNQSGAGVTVKTTAAAGSATAFQVNNSGGQNLFQVDTANNNIIIGGNNSGALQPWATNANPLPAARYFHSSVVANGYIYVLGGRDCCGRNATVYYAKINSDGSTGAWNTSPNALPQALSGLTSVVANGYIYAIGGVNSSGNRQATVYYARLNPDGSTGTWSTNTYAVPQPLSTHTSIVANGYVYVIGGTNDSGVNQSTVYYARLNSDGSTGSWSTDTNALPQARTNHSSVMANGYVYVIGGYDAGNNVKSTVYYAKLNSDGSTGSWSTNVASLPQSLYEQSSVVANGYVYVIGGGTTSQVSTVYYAKLNLDGSTGSWSTNANALPQALDAASAVVANGYVYSIGGVAAGSNNLATVYYASTQRVQIGGSVDLVGLAGQDLVDPGSTGGVGATGGELTAGNTNVIGSLQVQGASQFAQGLGVGGPLTVGATGSIAGSLTLGTASSATGQIVLENAANGNGLTLQAGATSAAYTFTLPTSGGTNNYVLTTNGSGTTSWSSIPGVASVTTANGNTTITTTTETAVASYTVPANGVQAGTVFRIHAWGNIDNGTTAVTFTPNIRWGGTGGTSCLAAPTIVGTTTAQSGKTWDAEAYLTIVSTGAAGTAECTLTLKNHTASPTGAFSEDQADSGPTAVAGIDTTTNQALVLDWTLSDTTGSPVLRCYGASIEIVKP